MNAIHLPSEGRCSAQELPVSHLLPAYTRPALVIERGEGCYFWDNRGRCYLDFISGVGVNALGHNHPRVVRPIQEQAAFCVHTSNLFHHSYQEPLAALLAEWTGLSRVFFLNSGTEAVELALKGACAFRLREASPRRKRFVALENSFHGRTTGSLAVTGRKEYRRPFEPLFADTTFIPANDRQALALAIGADTAAVITETIQGEGGVHPLSGEFLADVRELTRARNALWIADETQCGLGRTGVRFAYQLHNVGLPDIVISAKPLAGGLPLAATVFSEKAARAFGPGMHGSTFGGGPLTCRVALEVLAEIDRLLPHVREMGAYLLESLQNLRSRHRSILEIRGAGLMAGIQLHHSGQGVVEECLARGLAINCTRETVLRLLPPYIVTQREIDAAMEILGDVLD
jgi:acetylornithine aminotransferase/acetylornithine/N-succinyldiaminopimelate aminotransferase